MKIYLMRHGIAEEMGMGIPTDAERPLSEEGRRKTAEIAKGLRVVGAAPRRLISSPLLRARETAEIVARILHGAKSVELEEALAPGGEFQALLHALRGADDTLAVGHMPDLSEVAGRLLTGDARGAFDFRKGGVACFEFEGPARPGQGALEWFLPPRLLRKLASA